MRDRLERGFFARETLTVARELLGQRLVSVESGRRVSGTIVEVEAYMGESDRASHARSGPTERNRSMYGPPGCAYVYFIYGMHYCLNLVTAAEGFPAAVLIRALQPEEGVAEMAARRGGRRGVDLTNGPAKLCQALAIDRRFDGADLCAAEALLFVEQAEAIPEPSLARSPRVNVRGDEPARAAPWRIYVANNPYVSHGGRRRASGVDDATG